MEYDLLFKNAKIIDGSGIDAFIGDVAVSGDKIVKIAQNISEHAKQIINVDNNVLAPGFIDAHSHSDISIMYNNNPKSKVYQGITTEVIGNCGFSPFPLKSNKSFINKRRESLGYIDVKQLDWNWTDLNSYFTAIEKVKPNVNLVTLVGHGSIRAMVKGYDNSNAKHSELVEMQRILADHFDKGIFGMSTGLGYAPDFYSDIDELIALAQVVKQYNGIFAFHIRGDRTSLFNAVNEVLTVGKRSGAKIQISHLKCASKFNHGRVNELLGIIENAIEDGVDVQIDIYPYIAGSSYLGLVFPPWTHEGGYSQLIKRLKDKKIRKKIFNQMMKGTEGWSSLLSEANGKNLVVSDANKYKEIIGKTLWEISKDWNMSLPSTVSKLMIEENGNVDILMFIQREEDMLQIAAYYKTIFGTDGLAMDPDKKIIRTMPHPRSYGSFPKIIREIVKEKKILSLEQAINKMTYATACRFSIGQRGIIKEGCYADIIVFNEDEFTDKATYENPHLLSFGLRHMVVNGELLIKDGVLLNNTKGKILKKYDCK